MYSAKRVLSDECVISHAECGRRYVGLPPTANSLHRYATAYGQHVDSNIYCTRHAVSESLYTQSVLYPIFYIEQFVYFYATRLHLRNAT